MQLRGPGDSVHRRTLKIEKLLSASPSRKSALIKIHAVSTATLGDATLVFRYYFAMMCNQDSFILRVWVAEHKG